MTLNDHMRGILAAHREEKHLHDVAVKAKRGDGATAIRAYQLAQRRKERLLDAACLECGWIMGEIEA